MTYGDTFVTPTGNSICQTYMVNRIICYTVPNSSIPIWSCYIILEANKDDTVRLSIDLRRQRVTLTSKECTPCAVFTLLPGPCGHLSICFGPYTRYKIQRLIFSNRNIFFLSVPFSFVFAGSILLCIRNEVRFSSSPWKVSCLICAVIENNVYVCSRESICIDILTIHLISSFGHCLTRVCFVSVTRCRPNKSVYSFPVQFIVEIQRLLSWSLAACAIESREYVTIERRIATHTFTILCNVTCLTMSISSEDFNTGCCVFKIKRIRILYRVYLISISINTQILTTRQFNRVTTLHHFYSYKECISRVNLNFST